MFERLTVKAQELLEAASRLARQDHHPQIEMEHLFLAMLRQQEGIITPLLNRPGLNPAML